MIKITRKIQKMKQYLVLLAFIIWSAGQVFSQNKQKEIFAFDFETKNLSKLDEAV